MEFDEQGGRFGGDREATQDLCGVSPVSSADFAEQNVALPQSARRRELRRHALIGLGHRRNCEVVDVVGSTFGQVGRLDYRRQLRLIHPDLDLIDDGRDRVIREPGGQFQPVDLLGRLDQSQLLIAGV